MFLSLCCLVLIIITIITRTVQTSAWVCLLCDQSPERHDLVSFPDMLAEGGQVSNYDPVGGTKYGLKGCNKNSRNPNQNAAKQTVDSHPVGRCVCCGTKAKMRSISASSTLLSFWASSTLLLSFASADSQLCDLEKLGLPLWTQWLILLYSSTAIRDRTYFPFPISH